MILTQRDYDAIIAEHDDGSIGESRRRLVQLVHARNEAMARRAPLAMVRDLTRAINALDRAASDYLESLCDAHGD